jgi:hypothetical protein
VEEVCKELLEFGMCALELVDTDFVDLTDQVVCGKLIFAPLFSHFLYDLKPSALF